ncbi:hypothetical protein ANOBCDAF_03953 [Pleomorphomonas sp. T1.2MG-36]|uniref:DUF4376 domain-containing protein n=1 Tax=Pleomorphomonas sp. T1.2MG-36 TaxID=3041167 RepID=UPI0024778BE3|nr:hypothetical protein [Pleomorphomonas sp. T1.2MG-36]CAI9417343.1 hypothetical protein ANOBCDAF_03953 [Pleomorphomonas sp. T1.2MG-36]
MTLYLKVGAGYVAWNGEPIAGVRHPLSIEDAWPAEELAAIGLFVPRVAVEVPEDKIAVELSVEDVAGRPAYVWQTRDPTLAELRATKLAAISASADVLLSAGAPVAGGLHVALDDGSRADLTAMASTATAASTGTLPWPESYSRGWIAVENLRIPLATPADGLALVASVGDWYAAVVQHRRDQKDAALAAGDAAALEAIDPSAGWPAA